MKSQIQTLDDALDSEVTQFVKELLATELRTAKDPHRIRDILTEQANSLGRYHDFTEQREIARKKAAEISESFAPLSLMEYYDSKAGGIPADVWNAYIKGESNATATHLLMQKEKYVSDLVGRSARSQEEMGRLSHEGRHSAHRGARSQTTYESDLGSRRDDWPEKPAAKTRSIHNKRSSGGAQDDFRGWPGVPERKVYPYSTDDFTEGKGSDRRDEYTMRRSVKKYDPKYVDCIYDENDSFDSSARKAEAEYKDRRFVDNQAIRRSTRASGYANVHFGDNAPSSRDPTTDQYTRNGEAREQMPLEGVSWL